MPPPALGPLLSRLGATQSACKGSKQVNGHSAQTNQYITSVLAKGHGTAHPPVANFDPTLAFSLLVGLMGKRLVGWL